MSEPNKTLEQILSEAQELHSTWCPYWRKEACGCNLDRLNASRMVTERMRNERDTARAMATSLETRVEALQVEVDRLKADVVCMVHTTSALEQLAQARLDGLREGFMHGFKSGHESGISLGRYDEDGPDEIEALAAFLASRPKETNP